MSPVLLNRLTLLLSFAGVFIAGVLSVAAFYEIVPPCGASPGCAVVTSHASSKLAGISVSYLGLGAYLVLAALAVMRSLKGPASSRTLVLLGFIIAAGGTLFSLYLQYIAFSVIGQVCWWCLASAVTITALLVLHGLMLQSDVPAEEAPAKSGDLGIIVGLAAVAAIALTANSYAMISDAKANPYADKIKENQKKNTVELVSKDSHILGDPSAPVTIVEFADLQCPACRQSFPKLQEVVRKYDGKVRVVFRHFPLRGHPEHPMAEVSAFVAEIAAEKGKFYEFIDAIFQRQTMELQTIDQVMNVAESVGLSSEEIKRRVEDENDPALGRLNADISAAHQLGLQTTPTLFLIVPGEDPEPIGTAAIDSELASERVQKHMGAGSG